MKTIKAAVVREQGGPLEFEEVQLVEPKNTEVQVRLVASGVCHTDHSGRYGNLAPFPVILGHEGAGIVEAVGENVTEFEVGDHVAISYAHCASCSECLSGRPSTCLRMLELNAGGKAEDGEYRHFDKDGEGLSMFFGQSSFATHANVEEKNIVKVPKDMDLTIAAPLGCGIQTGAGTVLNTFTPEFGDSIIVLGTGAVGLSAIMAAKIAGYKNIIAVNHSQPKLDKAGELGATHLINNKETPNFAEEVKKIVPHGVEWAIDTTGRQEVVIEGLDALKSRGTMACVGILNEFETDLYEKLIAEGKTLKGVIEGDSIPKKFIPELIHYYQQGLFPYDEMIEVFEFEDLEEAFQTRAIKPVVRISDQ